VLSTGRLVAELGQRDSIVVEWSHHDGELQMAPGRGKIAEPGQGTSESEVGVVVHRIEFDREGELVARERESGRPEVGPSQRLVDRSLARCEITSAFERHRCSMGIVRRQEPIALLERVVGRR